VVFKSLNKLIIIIIITQEKCSLVDDKASIERQIMCVANKRCRKGKLEGGYLTGTDIRRFSGCCIRYPPPDEMRPAYFPITTTVVPRADRLARSGLLYVYL
jgi:hypothetical protein